MSNFLMPFLPLNAPEVFDKCMEDGVFDDFFLEKFLYINRSFDLDMFQLSGDERLTQLQIAWNNIRKVIHGYSKINSEEFPKHVEHILINLVHLSMNLWFSLEWRDCDHLKRCDMLLNIAQLRSVFMKVPQLKELNWLYLIELGLKPWSNDYFKKYLSKEEQDADEASKLPYSEKELERLQNSDDIEILRQEGLLISLLRLIKLFDAGSMEAVKNYSIHIISAFNHVQLQNGNDDVHPEIKRCLNMISHIHIMAVYETDNNGGSEIDNMIYDIRFYHKTILDAQQSGKILDDEFYKHVKTPACLIAMTSVKMKQTFQDLAESAISDLSQEPCNTLFGVISHRYITYLLANILIDLNKQKIEDFAANIDTYKRLLNIYVVEREHSERFALNEDRRIKLQNTSHNITFSVSDLYTLKDAIGKGNRCSNIEGNSKTNQCEQERAELFEMENEKRYDPVFQTMPNNEKITNEFYEILSKSNYKGWHYARLLLLLNIIAREINEINKWCYHPGLTTDFMLNLEITLAKRFEDLAIIFEDHIFMEQEFWLTAFYLYPVQSYFDKVIFCGQRFLRTVNYLNRGSINEMILKPSDKTSANCGIPSSTAEVESESGFAFMNAKYGLLSSTFDVKEIANMTTRHTAQIDYNSLSKALRMLRLPENIIKDLLTVTFSHRHANYTWAADWTTLRRRCKALLLTPELKRQLVESNMAEANDRLKYLKIDYKKYQNLPQLDYGTIEAGYEDDYKSDDRTDQNDDSDDNDDLDENPQCATPRKITRKIIIIDDEEEFEPSDSANDSFELPDPDEINSTGKRSSARRAAAVIASAMLREDYHMKLNKRKEELKLCEKPNINTPAEINEEENPLNKNLAEIPTTSSTQDETENFDEKFKKLYENSTTGFIPIKNNRLDNNIVKSKKDFPPFGLKMSTFEKFVILAEENKTKPVTKTFTKINYSPDTTDDEFDDNTVTNNMSISDIESEDSQTEIENYNKNDMIEQSKNIKPIEPQKKQLIEILDTQIFYAPEKSMILPSIESHKPQQFNYELQQFNSENNIFESSIFNHEASLHENVKENNSTSFAEFTETNLDQRIEQEMCKLQSHTVNTQQVNINIDHEKSVSQNNTKISNVIEIDNIVATIPNEVLNENISPQKENSQNVTKNVFSNTNDVVETLTTETEKIVESVNEFDYDDIINSSVVKIDFSKMTNMNKPVSTASTPSAPSTPPTVANVLETALTDSQVKLPISVETLTEVINESSDTSLSETKRTIEALIPTSSTLTSTDEASHKPSTIVSPLVSVQPIPSTVQDLDLTEVTNSSVVSTSPTLKPTSSDMITPSPPKTLTSTTASFSNDKDKSEANKEQTDLIDFSNETAKPNENKDSVAKNKTEKEEKTDSPTKTMIVKIAPQTESRASPLSKKRRMTGKPKSFSSMLTQQQLSDESSSQSSSFVSQKTQVSTPNIESEPMATKTSTTSLIRECLQSKCFVKMKRICMERYAKKFQPTVRLKRFNMKKYFEEKNASAALERKKSRSRSKSKPKYFESGESSSPAPFRSRSRKRKHNKNKRNDDLSMSSDEDYKPEKMKKRRPSSASLSTSSQESESNNAVNKSLQHKKLKRSLSTASSSSTNAKRRSGTSKTRNTISKTLVNKNLQIKKIKKKRASSSTSTSSNIPLPRSMQQKRKTRSSSRASSSSNSRRSLSRTRQNPTSLISHKKNIKKRSSSAISTSSNNSRPSSSNLTLGKSLKKKGRPPLTKASSSSDSQLTNMALNRSIQQKKRFLYKTKPNFVTGIALNKSIQQNNREYSPPTTSLSSQKKMNPTISLQHKSREQNRNRNFSVVPRSGSGLKVCISSRDVQPMIECIELSSSENDEPPIKFDAVNFVVDEDNPLYEVETDMLL